MLRTLIFIGQMGRIWSKRRMDIKIFQSFTAIGFFVLLTKKIRKEFDNDQKYLEE